MLVMLGGAAQAELKYSISKLCLFVCPINQILWKKKILISAREEASFISLIGYCDDWILFKSKKKKFLDS